MADDPRPLDPPLPVDAIPWELEPLDATETWLDVTDPDLEVDLLRRYAELLQSDLADLRGVLSAALAQLHATNLRLNRANRSIRELMKVRELPPQTRVRTVTVNVGR
jgi:hypothetical protein